MQDMCVFHCFLLSLSQLTIRDRHDTSHLDRELVVVIPLSGRPVVGVRGGADWTYTVGGLRPSSPHKIVLHLRAEEVNVRGSTLAS